jgi:ParB family transcriptional regulator, chromosome partitioning protein
VKRKDTLKSLLSVEPGAEPGDEEEQTAGGAEHTPSGAVRAMGLNLGQLKADAEEGRLLKEQLVQGLQVVDLDPSQLDPSFVTDRLAEPEEEHFAALVSSIKANGQLVPILARPHPEQQGRFQVAYGHRRVRAVEVLQLKVKAVVRELSDEEMVIAQGKENSDRRDLSFIERALFAQCLEDRGFDRNVLMAALSVDKTEIAKLLSVVRSIPTEIIQAIGPAPRTGRPRWISLSQLLSRSGATKRISAIIGTDSFKNLNSDRRFDALLAAMSEPRSKSVRDHWSDPNGRRVVTIQRGLKQTTFIFNERLEPAFGDYVAENLGNLYTQFKSRGGEAD